MHAIEFKSQLEHGQISVPSAFHLLDGQPVRVLILLDDATPAEDATQPNSESIWQRTAGSWQGSDLVRDPQGEHDQRPELE